MPPKHRRQNNHQPTLTHFSNHPHTHSLLTKQEQLEKEMAKLIKVRKEIESRQIQESKIIKKILTLQIDQTKTIKQQQQKQQDEEYLILTTDQNIQNLQSPSILKLILGDYGCLYQTKLASQQQNNKQQTQQSYLKQWKQHGNINQQFLTQYSNDFIHYLQEMQYVADSFTTTKNK